jgi:hypothetical protein
MMKLRPTGRILEQLSTMKAAGPCRQCLRERTEHEQQAIWAKEGLGHRHRNDAIDDQGDDQGDLRQLKAARTQPLKISLKKTSASQSGRPPGLRKVSRENRNKIAMKLATPRCGGSRTWSIRSRGSIRWVLAMLRLGGDAAASGTGTRFFNRSG